jgi:hypothetical protein
MRADDRAPAPSPRDTVEEAVSRLRETIAILEAIEQADLLAELPADPEAAERHQCAVSLLTVLKRDLAALAGELETSHVAQDLMRRVSRSA